MLARSQVLAAALYVRGASHWTLHTPELHVGSPFPPTGDLHCVPALPQADGEFGMQDFEVAE